MLLLLVLLSLCIDDFSCMYQSADRIKRPNVFVRRAMAVQMRTAMV